MQDITSVRAAAKAVKARSPQVVEGCFEPEGDPEVVADITGRLTAARGCYRAAGNQRHVAGQDFDLGYPARHSQDDPTKARALSAEAPEAVGALGDIRQRLTALPEWGETYRDLPKAQEASAMALLRLKEIWIERKKHTIAHAGFERVEKMRGPCSYHRHPAQMTRYHFDHI